MHSHAIGLYQRTIVYTFSYVHSAVVLYRRAMHIQAFGVDQTEPVVDSPAFHIARYTRLNPPPPIWSRTSRSSMYGFSKFEKVRFRVESDVRALRVQGLKAGRFQASSLVELAPPPPPRRVCRSPPFLRRAPSAGWVRALRKYIPFKPLVSDVSTCAPHSFLPD